MSTGMNTPPIEYSFDTLLVANRGEIACRIMRTAHLLGLKTVAVYSDADSAAAHVEMADVAVRLGPAPAHESYLRADAVVEGALATGAGAIHPRYGFPSVSRASRSSSPNGRPSALPTSRIAPRAW